MKVQLVTPYRVSHLQQYGITLRGNVTVFTDLRKFPRVPCSLYFRYDIKLRYRIREMKSESLTAAKNRALQDNGLMHSS